MSSEKFLTYDEAKEAGYGSRTKLWEMTKDGTLPYYKNRGRVYFKQSDLDALYKPMNTDGKAKQIHEFAETFAAMFKSLSKEDKKEIADILKTGLKSND